MALYVCKRCSARFAVGLHRCPQCTGESAFYLDDAAEAEVLAGGPAPGSEGDVMAKITVHGGASNARFDAPEVTEPEPVAEEVSELVPGASVDADPDPETSDDEDGSAATRRTRAKPAKAARSR